MQDKVRRIKSVLGRVHDYSSFVRADHQKSFNVQIENIKQQRMRLMHILLVLEKLPARIEATAHKVEEDPYFDDPLIMSESGVAKVNIDIYSGVIVARRCHSIRHEGNCCNDNGHQRRNVWCSVSPHHR